MLNTAGHIRKKCTVDGFWTSKLFQSSWNLMKYCIAPFLCYVKQSEQSHNAEKWPGQLQIFSNHLITEVKFTKKAENHPKTSVELGDKHGSGKDTHYIIIGIKLPIIYSTNKTRQKPNIRAWIQKITISLYWKSWDCRVQYQRTRVPIFYSIPQTAGEGDNYIIRKGNPNHL